jgi:hypothetical protein
MSVEMYIGSEWEIPAFDHFPIISVNAFSCWIQKKSKKKKSCLTGTRFKNRASVQSSSDNNPLSDDSVPNEQALIPEKAVNGSTVLSYGIGCFHCSLLVWRPVREARSLDRKRHEFERGDV